MCLRKKKLKEKREKGLLLPNDEFSVYKSNRKTYLDNQGKIRQDINYTLIPKEKTKTSKAKIILLSLALGAFLLGCLIFMAFVYKMDVKQAIFEFANNYLFVGAITLFVFLVFKSKK